MNPDFVEFMKEVENDELRTTGSPVRHPSPEGGNDTVGYGHKLNVLEDQTGQVYGMDIGSLTEPECELILIRDLHHRCNNLRQRLSPAVWDNLSDTQQEILIEFEFNVGHVEKKFPKFYAALLKSDIQGMRDEYAAGY